MRIQLILCTILLVVLTPIYSQVTNKKTSALKSKNIDREYLKSGKIPVFKSSVPSGKIKQTDLKYINNQKRKLQKAKIQDHIATRNLPKKGSGLNLNLTPKNPVKSQGYFYGGRIYSWSPKTDRLELWARADTPNSEYPFLEVRFKQQSGKTYLITIEIKAFTDLILTAEHFNSGYYNEISQTFAKMDEDNRGNGQLQFILNANNSGDTYFILHGDVTRPSEPANGWQFVKCNIKEINI